MNKIAYPVMYAAYALSAVYTLFFSGIDRAPLGAVSLLFLLVPGLVERLFRFRLGRPMEIIVLAFCFLSFNLGVALRWFDRYPGYDNFAHFLSGILFTLAGLCVYVRMGGVADRRHQKLLQIAFAFFFSLSVAVVWEIGEFSGFLLTGHDSQHHLDTGVFDTMEDMISCVAGSLLAAFDYFLYVRRGKAVFFGAVLAFDEAGLPPAA